MYRVIPWKFDMEYPSIIPHVQSREGSPRSVLECAKSLTSLRTRFYILPITCLHVTWAFLPWEVPLVTVLLLS
jgi:hypothetical protein